MGGGGMIQELCHHSLLSDRKTQKASSLKNQNFEVI